MKSCGCATGTECADAECTSCAAAPTAVPTTKANLVEGPAGQALGEVEAATGMDQMMVAILGVLMATILCTLFLTAIAATVFFTVMRGRKKRLGEIVAARERRTSLTGGSTGGALEMASISVGSDVDRHAGLAEGWTPQFDETRGAWYYSHESVRCVVALFCCVVSCRKCRGRRGVALARSLGLARRALY